MLCKYTETVVRKSI